MSTLTWAELCCTPRRVLPRGILAGAAGFWIGRSSPTRCSRAALLPFLILRSRSFCEFHSDAMLDLFNASVISSKTELFVLRPDLSFNLPEM